MRFVKTGADIEGIGGGYSIRHSSSCIIQQLPLAFGYRSQAPLWYEFKYWVDVFELAIQSKQGLPADVQQLIVKHFETNPLQVVWDGSTSSKVITRGERPCHPELEGHGEGIILPYLATAKQGWQNVGVWHEFRRDGPGFMKETVFVVAIIVRVIFILHCLYEIIFRRIGTRLWQEERGVEQA